MEEVVLMDESAICSYHMKGYDLAFVGKVTDDRLEDRKAYCVFALNFTIHMSGTKNKNFTGIQREAEKLFKKFADGKETEAKLECIFFDFCVPWNAAKWASDGNLASGRKLPPDCLALSMRK